MVCPLTFCTFICFGFTVAAADFGLENTLRRNIDIKQMCLNDGTDANNCYNGELVEGSDLRSVWSMTITK